MRRRHLIPLGLFAALAIALGAGLRLNPREVPSALIDAPAPAFNLPLLASPDKRLRPGDLKGRVWLLNVWASWCTACRTEHPLLVELARRRQVPIYGLNYKDDPRAAQEWLRRLGDPYVASLVDRDGRVGIDYGVYGVPETFVIDRDGVIRFKHVGPVTDEVWQRTLLPLIGRLQG